MTRRTGRARRQRGPRSAFRVEAAGTALDLGAPAVRRQVGPRVDLDSPSLIVGKVQVQAVELVHRDQIDVTLHFVDAEEVPRDVKKGAAPPEARLIADLRGRHEDVEGTRASILDRPGQQLPQRLHAVEHTRGRGRDDAYASGRDSELIAFLALRRAAGDLEPDDAGCRCARAIADRQRRFERGRHELGNPFPDALQVRLTGRDLDDGALRDLEPLGRVDGGGCRPRDDRRLSHCGLLAPGGRRRGSGRRRRRLRVRAARNGQ